jgi:hypothetical protein
MNTPTLMRVFTVILAAGFLLNAGPAMAGEHVPKNLRICVQFIEMPHTALTELMSGKAQPGHVLHEKAMAMTKEGKAKVVESAMVIAPSGQRAKIDTIRELIYPTEYSPMPSLPPTPPPNPTKPLPSPRFFYTDPMNFETRDIGVSLDFEPTFFPDTSQIQIRFAVEILDLSHFHMFLKLDDEWGKNSIQMPVFDTWRTNTDLSLQPGKFDLATTITPKPTEPVPATLRKILVFVRCDVIAVGKP